jgi:hypothetical protein
MMREDFILHLEIRYQEKVINLMNITQIVNYNF